MIRTWFFILSLVLAAAGLLIIFNSVSWGIEAANAYLRSLGGGMDTAQYMIVLQEYINTYQWIGGILSIVGGLGAVRAVELRPGN